MSNTKFKIFALIGACIITLFFAELALRFLADHTGLFQRIHTDLVLFYPDNPFIPDKELGWRFSPGANTRYVRTGSYDTRLEINKQGFHDRDFTKEKTGGYRVCMVGDSLTAGIEVGVEETWCKILEGMMNSGIDKGIEIYNFGVTAYSNTQEKILIEKEVLGYDPDLVCLVYYPNDIPDDRSFPSFREPYKNAVIHYQDQAQLERSKKEADRFCSLKTQETLVWFYENIYLSRPVMNILTGSGIIKKIKPTIGKTEILRDYAASTDLCLGQLIELNRSLAQRGIRFCVIWLDYPRGVMDEYISSRRSLQEGLENSGIPQIQTESFFSQPGIDIDSLHWKTDEHFNQRGHKLFAGYLFSRFKEEKLAFNLPLN